MAINKQIINRYAKMMFLLVVLVASACTVSGDYIILYFFYSQLISLYIGLWWDSILLCRQARALDFPSMMQVFEMPLFKWFFFFSLK
jgi:hypothetical protein